MASTITPGQFEGTAISAAAYGSAIPSGHAVKHDSTSTEAVPRVSLAASGEDAEGIASCDAVTPAAGDILAVYKSGKGRAVVLAASPNIAPGDWLGPASNSTGKLVKVTTGKAIAQALAPATADDVEIPVFIQQIYLGS